MNTRLIALAAVLLLAGCAAPAPAASPSPAASASPAASPLPEPSPTAQPATYTNPVYASDFPDPFILRVGGTYYGYATNKRDVNVPTIQSTDLVSWEWVGDALPKLPGWAGWYIGATWAPSVLERGGRYVLYYTARHTDSGRQCISRAVSSQPEGPFVDDSSEPFICQVDQGGSIDPSPFVDADGQAYLLWKNDGNCCNMPTLIWSQTLSEDGLSVTGQPAPLIKRDQLWEQVLVEGPSMWLHDGVYYLFYSAGKWDSAEYAVGYAVCDSPAGPCTKPQKQPLLAYGNTVLGPGGQEFFTDVDGNLWMAYHGWTAPDVGYPQGARSLRLEPVTFADGQPVIEGPTIEPQPLP